MEARKSRTKSLPESGLRGLRGALPVRTPSRRSGTLIPAERSFPANARAGPPAAARRRCERRGGGGPMASLGGGSLGLVLWLLLFRLPLGGAQGESASSAPSPSPSGGRREDPRESVSRGAGSSATPEPQEAAAFPQVAAVTPPDSGIYRTAAFPQPLVISGSQFPAGDVSGQVLLRRTGLGPGGWDSALGEGLMEDGFSQGREALSGPSPAHELRRDMAIL